MTKTKKGWSKQATGERRKRATVQSVKPAGSFEQQICTTRLRDRNSGKFLPAPPPQPVTALDRSTMKRTHVTDMRAPAMNSRGQVVQRHYQRDGEERVLSRVTVVDTAARRLEAEGAITTRQRQKQEADTAAEVFARERGGKFWQEYESGKMREGHNSSKGQRAAHTRTQNAEAREVRRKRIRDTKRLGILRQMQTVERLETAMHKARTPATRDKYAAQLRTARSRLVKVREEFRKAGGDLGEITPTRSARTAPPSKAAPVKRASTTRRSAQT